MRPLRHALGLASTLGAVAAASCTIFDGYSLPLDGGSDAPTGAHDAIAHDTGSSDALSDRKDTGLDPYATGILASHPLAYYRFDESSGSIAYDSSGNHRECTYASGVTLGVPGAIPNDTAVRFSGVNLGVSCMDSLFDFSGMEAFSIEGWYAPDNLEPAYQAGFSRLTKTPRSGYYLFLAGAGASNIGFEFWSDNINTCNADGADFPCAGGDGGSSCAFVYIAATFDGTTMSVYVNGELEQTGSCSPGLMGVGDPFTMGNYSQLECPSCGLMGSIDEFALYDRALRADEVATHYAAR
jgi:concanavalin A-like lectin/glucanase superfamily protein